MKKIALLLIGFLYSASVCAVSADDQNILDQLKVLNDRLKSSSMIETCKAPDGPACSFQSMCQQFAGKGRNFYLYQNAEGRQIPNFAMTTTLSMAEECFEADAEDQRVNDPFVYTYTLFDADLAGSPDQLHKNFVRYEQEGLRAEKLFNETKAQILAMLNSRRTTQNAKEIDNMIGRVRTTGFNFPKENTKLKDLAKDGCEIPNAFYSPYINAVTVCPQILNLPDASLVSTFAHELGHTIDPCTLQNSVAASDNGFGKNVFDEIASAQNPLKSVISCLQQPNSMNIRFGETTDCRDKAHSDHMREAFSDWVSSQVLKAKLATIQDPNEARRYAFESQAVFLGRSCKNVQQTAVAYVRPIVQRQCVNLTALMDDADEPDDVTTSHPSTANRVNRILYAPPEMQKALGCKSTDPVLTECK